VICGWTDTTLLARIGAVPKHAARQTNGELSRIKINDSRVIPLRWSVRLVTNGICRLGDAARSDASLPARVPPLQFLLRPFLSAIIICEDITRGGILTLRLAIMTRHRSAYTNHAHPHDNVDNVILFAQVSSQRHPPPPLRGVGEDSRDPGDPMMDNLVQH